MRLVLSVICVLAFVSIGIAQKYKISLKSGYGTYQLNDLRGLQNDFATQGAWMHIEKVQQLPGYLNYSVSVEYFVNPKNLIGINGAYYTTGGRNHISDYSGEYALNMPLNGYRLGVQYRNVFAGFNKINMYVSADGGMMLSVLSISETLTLYPDHSNTEAVDFTSISFTFDPSVGAWYPLAKKVSLDISLGYQVYLESTLFNVDNVESELTDFRGNPVRLNWSGLRLGIGISYNLQ